MPDAIEACDDSVPRGAQILSGVRAYGVNVVGGGHFIAPSIRARHMQGRTHWWAVLAVSVALMALVTAASAGHSLGSLVKPHVTANQLPAPTPAMSQMTHGGTTTTLESNHSATASAVLGLHSQTTAGPSTTSNPGTTSTTAPTTAQSGNGSSPPLSGTDQIDQGYLNPPEDTTAVEPFSGNGPITVSVTWSGSTTLALSASCGDDSQDASGSSPIAVTLTAATESCQATLTEPSSATQEVNYTLTIGTANND